MSYQLPAGKVLVLRACAGDLTSRDGFKWPENGDIKAPDWKPTKECGHGLHGWLWAQGDFSAANYRKSPDAKWLLVEVDQKKIIDLNGKVKFPEGKVIFCGFWWDAFAMARRYRPRVKKLEAAATGDSGHAAATGGSGHAAATGESGHAAATGESGHAAATGYSGHAAATGDCGHAAATGESAIAAALGFDSVVKAGEKGCIVAAYFDKKKKRPRVLVGYVGEDGILPEREYVVVGGKFALKGGGK